MADDYVWRNKRSGAGSNMSPEHHADPQNWVHIQNNSGQRRNSQTFPQAQPSYETSDGVNDPFLAGQRLGQYVTAHGVHPAVHYLLIAVGAVALLGVGLLLLNARMTPKAVFENGRATYSAESWNHYFWLPWVHYARTIPYKGSIIINGGELKGVTLTDPSGDLTIEAPMDHCSIFALRGTLTVANAINSGLNAHHVVVTGNIRRSAINTPSLTNHGSLSKDVRLFPYFIQ